MLVRKAYKQKTSRPTCRPSVSFSLVSFCVCSSCRSDSASERAYSHNDAFIRTQTIDGEQP
jgi:hypothetical protein